MKYIQKFKYVSNDNIPKNTKFKIGDYVVVDGKGYSDESKTVYEIIGYNKNKYGSTYRVQEINTKKDNEHILWSPKNLRKATPEEIIEFELNQSTNKYNL